MDSLFKKCELVLSANKFEEAEELIQKLNQMKYQIILEIRKRKSDQDYFRTRLGNRYNWDSVTHIVRRVQHRLHYLQQALEEHRVSSTADGNNRRIQQLCHRVQHVNNNLAEERSILKTIKHAKEQQEKAYSHVDIKPRKQYCQCLNIPESEEEVKDQINLVLSELQELKKKQKPVVFYEENLRKDLEEAEKDISFFQKQLEGIDMKKHELYAYILDLSKQRKGGI